MGITIRIFKNEADKIPSLIAEAAALSQVTIERDDVVILSPRSGSLFDVLRVLTKYNVEYELKNSNADNSESAH